MINNHWLNRNVKARHTPVCTPTPWTHRCNFAVTSLLGNASVLLPSVMDRPNIRKKKKKKEPKLLLVFIV